MYYESMCKMVRNQRNMPTMDLTKCTLPTLITLITLIVGIAVAWGVLRTNVFVMRDDIIRLEVKVDKLTTLVADMRADIAALKAINQKEGRPALGTGFYQNTSNTAPTNRNNQEEEDQNKQVAALQDRKHILISYKQPKAVP